MPKMPGTFRPRHLPDPRRDYELARGSARQRGYTSKWDKASKRFLQDNPVCPACGAAGFLEASRVTDHIIPHRGDQRLFWDPKNWQPCCRWHHDVVKQQLERMHQLNQVKASDLLLTSATALDLAARLRD
jgi:5-methylcytosine-specific restriction endonuclease McrA